MDLPKWRILLNAFFLSQLSYCPLVHSCGKNNKIIIYSDKKYTFIELLGKDNSVSINKRILRFLVIEMLKFKRALVPALCKIIPENRQSRYEF